MSQPTTARELWPLVEKLPHDEQLRLANLALRAAALGRSAVTAYRDQPPTADEFGTDYDPLSWEAGGWEELGEAR